MERLVILPLFARLGILFVAPVRIRLDLCVSCPEGLEPWMRVVVSHERKSSVVYVPPASCCPRHRSLPDRLEPLL